MICKNLGLFVNQLTVNNKCSVLNRDNLQQHFQMQLCQKQKIFSDFLFALSKLRFNFEHFQKKKKMTLVVDIFLNLRTSKDMVK